MARSRCSWREVPPADAASAARGFIRIAFRIQNGQFEYIYLRPTNDRADVQVRRNHSTNFSFASARQQAPEKYESYVDLEPGVWTRYRIVVEGTKAGLYVNGASQPFGAWSGHRGPRRQRNR
jgi:hypothetical protein